MISQNNQYIIDLFKEAVSMVAQEYDNEQQEKPYFIAGRAQEVLRMLCEKDDNGSKKFRKYPLIVLNTNVLETRGNPAYQYVASPVISIVYESDEELYTEDRYEESYSKVLSPIYELLLQEIADNPNFYPATKEEIAHTTINWDGNPVAGSSGITTNDYLDGINITFTDLQIFRKPSCPETIGKTCQDDS